jgi:F0F1-type ATP synthase assembly protein I
MPKKQKPAKAAAQRAKWVRFTHLGIQMAAVITIAAYAGDYLDSLAQNENPWYTIVLSLTGIGASLYLVFKEVNQGS